MPILSALGAGFGSDKWKAQLNPGAQPLIKPLSNLGVDTLKAIRTGADDFSRTWNAGTARQEGLMSDQEGVLRNLLNQRLTSDPTQLLRNVGGALTGLIDPNVISPLAKFDVNWDEIARRARGLNPAAIDSTSERLRNARIASGRYYDSLRTLSSILPTVYNQVYNAGINNADLASGYIPRIMAGYREIDRAPLVPLAARADLTNAGAGNVQAINNAIKAGIFGYQKDRNIFDRLGAVDTSMWNSLKDAVNMAATVYGGFLGGGAGGGLGGMLGGMGGGGTGGGAGGGSPSQAPAPTFLPAPAATPAMPNYSLPGSLPIPQPPAAWPAPAYPAYPNPPSPAYSPYYG